jgi:hypothetical protein
MLEVTQNNRETKGEFVATFDGRPAGLMTYSGQETIRSLLIQKWNQPTTEKVLVKLWFTKR